ncbi:cardiac-enriched FHL2-interacting protein isoform X2 [Rhineura floridana]|uniref:cardiac-enriched FHL2-interacting protein isoform X2 n=1 Tax=Rhineura floridana TaxID=261503 RepID=UPI002AC7FEFA|nr:cardiac-enriched FHL2-interacting protein isoform X2 [Rhineura floridana]
MQGNKKHTDGQSDSSSIGSLLDDTDREVCSLTDRAFKSLCVAELESSYTEFDPVVSPNISNQITSKFFQGPQNHAIKKNTLSNKGLPTFQQLPKDAQEGEMDTEGQKATTNNNPSIRKKLGLPACGLRNYTHTSKVSSLIKTFDKVENQQALAKQPVKNNLTKFPLICGTFWGAKTIVNIQRGLSEFSEPCHAMANVSSMNEIHKRQKKMDLVCQGAHGFCPSNIRTAVSKKIVKNQTGKAQEPAAKGSFLHSENSAFESWNLHHKKLIERGRSTAIIFKERDLTYFKETPFFKESCIPEHKSQKVTAPIILKQDFSDVFPQKPLSKAFLSPLSLAHLPFPPLSIAKDTVAQMLLPQVSDLPASACRIPSPQYLTSKTSFPPTPQVVASLIPISKASVPPQSLPQGTLSPETVSDVQELVTQVTELSEWTKNSEFKSEEKNVCPPWRRQKTALGGMKLMQEIAPEMLKMKNSLYSKPSDVTRLAETAVDESHVASSEHSSPSFNISTLLTPVIPPKQAAPESQLLLGIPPICEAGTVKEAEEWTLHSSQNNYKSKAPSLLFNLKDIRKRVKSTYSPSPLLKNFEDKKVKGQACVTAGNTLKECNKTFIEDDETGHKQTDSTHARARATSLIQDLPDSYLTLEDCEVSSVTELHPNEHSRRHYSPLKSYDADVTKEHEEYVQSFNLQDLKNKKKYQSHSTDVGPQVSPNLFFTPEENVNNENQACQLTGNGQKGKRSTSSSEQSFVSIIKQPFHDDSFFLMQLFQKACLEESQRSKNKLTGEEKLCSKGEEEKKAGGCLSICGSNIDEKKEGGTEQCVNENTVQERGVKETRDNGCKSMDCASEAKLEGPLTPTSSSSFKPNLFMIKDNTFKTSPVIKAVKLPLFRSLSCEDAITGGHVGTEKQAHGVTTNVEEIDLCFSRNRSQHNAKNATTDRDADESGSSPVNSCQKAEKRHFTEYILREGLGRSYAEELGDDKEANITSALSQKDLKGKEAQLAKDKEKSRAWKLNGNSSRLPNVGFDGDPAQNKQNPTREKANYFKNNLLSRSRGGYCVKKIISQDMRPPVSETRSHSSSDALRDTSVTLGNLVLSAIPSPRTDSVVQSTFTSPSSDTFAVFKVPPAENTANSSSLHGHSGKILSAMEAFDSIRQLCKDASRSPVANERLQLMGQMARIAAKPPAVPPKTEKTLRRAKKLACKRKKREAQQKRLQDEPTSHCDDIANLPPVQSSFSTCLNTPFTPSETNPVELQPTPSLSPTPSLPATIQRKVLQDPDSGEYFIVDLPIQLTFYDPENGRYVQVPIPPSKSNLIPMPSAENLLSSYVSYPSALPVRVSSVPAQASPSQFSEPASLLQEALLESASKWPQSGQYPEAVSHQPYIEPAGSDVHSEEADGSQYNFEKDVNADIISLSAIEDFDEGTTCVKLQFSYNVEEVM